MTSAPAMPTRSHRHSASDANQFEYDGLFQYSAAKQQLTIQEVATALGTSEKQIFAYLDEGLLYAAPISDQSAAIRVHRRIARFSVLALYFEQLAADAQPILFRQTPEILTWRNRIRASRKPPLPPLPVPPAT